MNINFSKHFQKQIIHRNLLKERIDQAIQNPDAIIQEEDGIKVYQKVFSGLEMYRVFINELKTPPLAVTAYKTTKIKKYEYKVR